jgi:hypothetical protein
MLPLLETKPAAPLEALPRDDRPCRGGWQRCARWRSGSRRLTRAAAVVRPPCWPQAVPRGPRARLARGGAGDLDEERRAHGALLFALPGCAVYNDTLSSGIGQRDPRPPSLHIRQPRSPWRPPLTAPGRGAPSRDALAGDPHTEPAARSGSAQRQSRPVTFMGQSVRQEAAAGDVSSCRHEPSVL